MRLKISALVTGFVTLFVAWNSPCQVHLPKQQRIYVVDHHGTLLTVDINPLSNPDSVSVHAVGRMKFQCTNEMRETEPVVKVMHDIALATDGALYGVGNAPCADGKIGHLYLIQKMTSETATGELVVLVSPVGRLNDFDELDGATALGSHPCDTHEGNPVLVVARGVPSPSDTKTKKIRMLEVYPNGTESCADFAEETCVATQWAGEIEVKSETEAGRGSADLAFSPADSTGSAPLYVVRGDGDVFVLATPTNPSQNCPHQWRGQQPIELPTPRDVAGLHVSKDGTVYAITRHGWLFRRPASSAFFELLHYTGITAVGATGDESPIGFDQ